VSVNRLRRLTNSKLDAFSAVVTLDSAESRRTAIKAFPQRCHKEGRSGLSGDSATRRQLDRQPGLPNDIDAMNQMKPFSANDERFDPSKKWKLTSSIVERPIRDHPKFKRERNKRKRERFVKACSRHGITSFTSPVIEWRERP